MDSSNPNVTQPFDVAAEKLSGEGSFIGDGQIGGASTNYKHRTGTFSLDFGPWGSQQSRAGVVVDIGQLAPHRFSMFVASTGSECGTAV